MMDAVLSVPMSLGCRRGARSVARSLDPTVCHSTADTAQLLTPAGVLRIGRARQYLPGRRQPRQLRAREEDVRGARRAGSDRAGSLRGPARLFGQARAAVFEEASGVRGAPVISTRRRGDAEEA